MATESTRERFPAIAALGLVVAGAAIVAAYRASIIDTRPGELVLAVAIGIVGFSVLVWLAAFPSRAGVFSARRVVTSVSCAQMVLLRITTLVPVHFGRGFIMLAIMVAGSLALPWAQRRDRAG